MKFTEGGFKKWGYELAEREFGDAIASGKLVIKDCIADAFLQNTLLIPEEYSVVATLNLNGDYISDQLAAMVGGIGIAPGANINYNTGHAIFEATHGTAPKPLFLFDLCFQQSFLHVQKVLRAHREAAQAQLQILHRVGRVAHRKAADGHRHIANLCGIHHHGDELFHGLAGRTVVVLGASKLPVCRVGILGQVVGADDEKAAAMGHKFFRRQAGRGHTEHHTERGILIERDAPLPQALAAPFHHLHGS